MRKREADDKNKEAFQVIRAVAASEPYLTFTPFKKMLLSWTELLLFYLIVHFFNLRFGL